MTDEVLQKLNIMGLDIKKISEDVNDIKIHNATIDQKIKNNEQIAAEAKQLAINGHTDGCSNRVKHAQKQIGAIPIIGIIVVCLTALLGVLSLVVTMIKYIN